LEKKDDKARTLSSDELQVVLDYIVKQKHAARNRCSLYSQTLKDLIVFLMGKLYKLDGGLYL